MKVKRLKGIRTIIYETDVIIDRGSFYIIIERNPLGVECWLGHTQYGIRQYLFGTGNKQYKDMELLEIINANMHEYVEDYMLNHFDIGNEEDFDYWLNDMTEKGVIL